MGYRIDFQSRPEYGGPRVTDGVRAVRPDQLFPVPPQPF